jgi:hypothetical protein
LDAIDEHHSRCTLSQGDRFPAVAIPCLAAPPSPLVDALSKLIERDRILDRPIGRIAKAADASFYRLVPQVVMLAKSEEEIRALFRLSQEREVPVTFRAAGTSLSGQSVTDGILVEVAQHWRSLSVLEDGKAFPRQARSDRRDRQRHAQGGPGSPLSTAAIPF